MSPSTRTLRRTALMVTFLVVIGGVVWLWTVNQRTEPVLVYFVAYDAPTFTLVAVPRTGLTHDVRSDSPAFAAARVAALVEGPRPNEGQSDLSTAVPEGTKVRAATFSKGELTVDLSAGFASGGGTASMLGRLEQLRWTLSEPEEVERVTLTLEGVPLEILGGEGLWVEATWSRKGASLPTW